MDITRDNLLSTVPKRGITTVAHGNKTVVVESITTTTAVLPPIRTLDPHSQHFTYFSSSSSSSLSPSDESNTSSSSSISYPHRRFVFVTNHRPNNESLNLHPQQPLPMAVVPYHILHSAWGMHRQEGVVMKNLAVKEARIGNTLFLTPLTVLNKYTNSIFSFTTLGSKPSLYFGSMNHAGFMYDSLFKDILVQFDTRYPTLYIEQIIQAEAPPIATKGKIFSCIELSVVPPPVELSAILRCDTCPVCLSSLYSELCPLVGLTIESSNTECNNRYDSLLPGYFIFACHFQCLYKSRLSKYFQPKNMVFLSSSTMIYPSPILLPSINAEIKSNYTALPPFWLSEQYTSAVRGYGQPTIRMSIHHILNDRLIMAGEAKHCFVFPAYGKGFRSSSGATVTNPFASLRSIIRDPSGGKLSMDSTMGKLSNNSAFRYLQYSSSVQNNLKEIFYADRESVLKPVRDYIMDEGVSVTFSNGSNVRTPSSTIRSMYSTNSNTASSMMNPENRLIIPVLRGILQFEIKSFELQRAFRVRAAFNLSEAARIASGNHTTIVSPLSSNSSTTGGGGIKPRRQAHWMLVVGDESSSVIVTLILEPIHIMDDSLKSFSRSSSQRSNSRKGRNTILTGPVLGFEIIGILVDVAVKTIHQVMDYNDRKGIVSSKGGSNSDDDNKNEKMETKMHIVETKDGIINYSQRVLDTSQNDKGDVSVTSRTPMVREYFEKIGNNYGTTTTSTSTVILQNPSKILFRNVAINSSNDTVSSNDSSNSSPSSLTDQRSVINHANNFQPHYPRSDNLAFHTSSSSAFSVKEIISSPTESTAAITVDAPLTDQRMIRSMGTTLDLSQDSLPSSSLSASSVDESNTIVAITGNNIQSSADQFGSLMYPVHPLLNVHSDTFSALSSTTSTENISPFSMEVEAALLSVRTPIISDTGSPLSPTLAPLLTMDGLRQVEQNLSGLDYENIIDEILSQIKDELLTASRDIFGNLIVQILFRKSNSSQRETLLRLFLAQRNLSVLELVKDRYGLHVIRSIILDIHSNQISHIELLSSMLQTEILYLCMDKNGALVVQIFLRKFFRSSSRFIFACVYNHFFRFLENDFSLDIVLYTLDNANITMISNILEVCIRNTVYLSKHMIGYRIIEKLLSFELYRIRLGCIPRLPELLSNKISPYCKPFEGPYPETRTKSLSEQHPLCDTDSLEELYNEWFGSAISKCLRYHLTDLAHHYPSNIIIEKVLPLAGFERIYIYKELFSPGIISFFMVHPYGTYVLYQAILSLHPREKINGIKDIEPYLSLLQNPSVPEQVRSMWYSLRNYLCDQYVNIVPTSLSSKEPLGTLLACYPDSAFSASETLVEPFRYERKFVSQQHFDEVSSSDEENDNGDNGNRKRKISTDTDGTPSTLFSDTNSTNTNSQANENGTIPIILSMDETEKFIYANILSLSLFDISSIYLKELSFNLADERKSSETNDVNPMNLSTLHLNSDDSSIGDPVNSTINPSSSIQVPNTVPSVIVTEIMLDKTETISTGPIGLYTTTTMKTIRIPSPTWNSSPTRISSPIELWDPYVIDNNPVGWHTGAWLRQQNGSSSINEDNDNNSIDNILSMDSLRNDPTFYALCQQFYGSSKDTSRSVTPNYSFSGRNTPTSNVFSNFLGSFEYAYEEGSTTDDNSSNNE